MARTQLAIQPLVRNGSMAPTYSAADSANGMFVDFEDAGKVLIHVKNTNAATRDITIRSGSVGDLSEAWMSSQGDLTATIAATTGDRIFGPFESARFGNANQLWLDFTAATNVTVAAFELP